jgi:pilus assembly protein Flp/PilA
MIRFYNLCKRALRNQRGATAIEYGLIAALLVLGVMASMKGALNASKAMWIKIDTEIGAATP